MADEPALALVDDRYEVLAELGRGGLGVALRARDRAADGAPLALKVVRDLGDAARGLLEAEYRALARLSHPAVPPPRDVGVVRRVERLPAAARSSPDIEAVLAALRPGAPFVARDLVEGQDLFAATRGRPWSEVRPLVVGLARALGAIHARGLVHGDLKPGNVIVVPGAADAWPVRLIDLGPGETVEYLAPERLRGAPPDRRADLFALGATLYRVLSGELPFPGRTASEVARALLRGRPAPLASRAPGLPPAVVAAVERLLEPAPARRWRSAAAFLRALGEASPQGEEGAVAPSLAAAPLVGRAAEAETLARALDLAAGQPRIVLVTGGPGSGKSRLLAEAALEARLRGLRVVAPDLGAGAG
ncbi:MAG: serine/threonine-protein kinase PknK, partial [Planctomycetes bacterium]|nr:serine/threonine-protein kinase PknK [Planctomycetota bacterium]